MSEESVICICKRNLSRFMSEENGIRISKGNNWSSNKNRPRKRGRQSKAQRKRRLKEKLSRSQSLTDDLERFSSSNKPENYIQGAVTPCKTGDKIKNRIRNLKETETLDNAIKVSCCKCILPECRKKEKQKCFESEPNVQKCFKSEPNVQKCFKSEPNVQKCFKSEPNVQKGYENASNVQKCIEYASNVQKCRQLPLHPSYSYLNKKHSESASKIQKQRQLQPQDDLNKKCTESPQSKKIWYKVILPQGCVLNPLQLINKICLPVKSPVQICLPVNQEQKAFNPLSSLILPNCIVNCDKTTDINRLDVNSHLHSSEISCVVENSFNSIANLNENRITVQTSDLSKNHKAGSQDMCNKINLGKVSELGHDLNAEVCDIAVKKEIIAEQTQEACLSTKVCDITIKEEIIDHNIEQTQEACLSTKVCNITIKEEIIDHNIEQTQDICRSASVIKNGMKRASDNVSNSFINSNALQMVHHNIFKRSKIKMECNDEISGKGIKSPETVYNLDKFPCNFPINQENKDYNENYSDLCNVKDIRGNITTRNLEFVSNFRKNDCNIPVKLEAIDIFREPSQDRCNLSCTINNEMIRSVTKSNALEVAKYK